MLNKIEIQEILEKKESPFETHIGCHTYKVTKCQLSGKAVTMKYDGQSAVVLGKIKKDGRSALAYIIIIVKTNEKYTASRSGFILVN